MRLWVIALPLGYHDKITYPAFERNSAIYTEIGTKFSWTVQSQVAATALLVLYVYMS